MLRNATEKASKKVLNLSFIHKDIGTIVQNLVVDFEASLKIVHGVRSQGQELVQSFLSKGIGPIKLLAFRVFEVFRCSQCGRNVSPDKILNVRVKTQNIFILIELSVLGTELLKYRHGYLFSHLYRKISSN